jgi:ribonuclease HepT-like protein
VSDARWIEIRANIDSAVRHFTDARRFYDLGAAEADDEMEQMAAMAFMHAMLAGHTSLEEAFRRIMGLVGEEPPTGDNWHADIVKRMGLPLEGLRPAFLGPDLIAHVQQTRKFRHVAVHTYDDFSWRHARDAVDSAAIVAGSIRSALESFQRELDPPRKEGDTAA